MLIGLLMVFIFGSGAESEFVPSVHNIQKEIRQHVVDEMRKDSLLILAADYEKTIKQYDKEKKKSRKKMNKASSDRTVSTEELLQLYDDYYLTRNQLISSLINFRILFQEQITVEEIALIFNDALVTTTKEQQKKEKAEDKAEEKFNKIFQDIHKIIAKHISDTTKLKRVSEDLLEFETTIYAYVEEEQVLEEARKTLVDKKEATRNELEELYENTNKLRYKASRNFAILREESIKNTDKREWNAINKELEVFTK
jgi:hypothetical protein